MSPARKVTNDFWWIAGSVLSRDKSTIILLSGCYEVFSSASNVKLFVIIFSKNSNLYNSSNFHLLSRLPFYFPDAAPAEFFEFIQVGIDIYLCNCVNTVSWLCLRPSNWREGGGERQIIITKGFLNLLHLIMFLKQQYACLPEKFPLMNFGKFQIVFQQRWLYSAFDKVKLFARIY